MDKSLENAQFFRRQVTECRHIVQHLGEGFLTFGEAKDIPQMPSLFIEFATGLQDLTKFNCAGALNARLRS
jgi:hypothetical protein